MSRKIDVVTLDGEEYDSLMADAERYRYLRDRMPRPAEGQQAFWLRRGEDLDEAIDAAIRDERPDGDHGGVK